MKFDIVVCFLGFGVIKFDFIQKKWDSFIKLLDTVSNSDVEVLIQFAAGFHIITEFQTFSLIFTSKH